MIRKRCDFSTKVVQMFMMKSLVNDDRKLKGNAMTLKTGDLSWCYLSTDFLGTPYFLYKILSKKFNFPKSCVCMCVCVGNYHRLTRDKTSKKCTLVFVMIRRQLFKPWSHTRYNTRISHESKRYTVEWKLSMSLSTEKGKQTLATRKIMCWDRFYYWRFLPWKSNS